MSHLVKQTGTKLVGEPAFPGYYVRPSGFISFLTRAGSFGNAPERNSGLQSAGMTRFHGIACHESEVFKEHRKFGPYTVAVRPSHHQDHNRGTDSEGTEKQSQFLSIMFLPQVIVVVVSLTAAFAQGGFGGLGLGGEGGGSHGGHYTGKSFAVFNGPVEGPVHQVHGTVTDKHGKHVEFVDYVAHPKYKYEYGVEDHHTGDNHGQAEIRDGDKVEGVYSLKEPGGNLRTVKYVSDHKGGFQASVINHGGNDHSGYAIKDHHGKILHEIKAHSYINFHGPVVGEAHPVTVSHGHGHGHYGY